MAQVQWLTVDRVVGALGGYYVATGVAPFVSRRAFEAVTGPKRQWWLVQTVSGLATASGLAMLSGAARGRVTPEIIGLAVGCSATFASLNTLHVARGRIKPTYVLDTTVEAAALAALALAGRGAVGRSR